MEKKKKKDRDNKSNRRAFKKSLIESQKKNLLNLHVKNGINI